METEITDITPDQYRLSHLSPRQFFTFTGEEVYMRVKFHEDMTDRLRDKLKGTIPAINIRIGHVHLYDRDSLVYKLRTNNTIHFHYEK